MLIHLYILLHLFNDKWGIKAFFVFASFFSNCCCHFNGLLLCTSFFHASYCSTLIQLYVVQSKSLLSNTIYLIFDQKKGNTMNCYYAIHIHTESGCPLLGNSVRISYYFDFQFDYCLFRIAASLELAMKFTSHRNGQSEHCE